MNPATPKTEPPPSRGSEKQFLEVPKCVNRNDDPAGRFVLLPVQPIDLAFLQAVNQCAIWSKPL